MKLEDLEIYNLAMNIGENVWNIVDTWNYFSKDTIGKQWTRAADSIAANISEGFGRYSYKDARKFYYIARGSLYESKTWLDKSNNRKLIPIETHTTMVTDLNNLGVKLNNFIKSHNKLITQEQ
ncbi:MAG: four helix bundle protein [Bacteroidales bacterium]|jgi:four helix bundle protein|nr:four helix bundle protein [Bacteroidales bacterium]